MPTKLGQNFLKDKSVIKKIIDVANLTTDDLVLEIGPGKGILTEELIKRTGKVIAVEIDEGLNNMLRNKLSNKKNVEIINADILKINLAELIKGSTLNRSKVEPWRKYKVIANLPYYITSPIIRLFLESDPAPQEMILMVQKEVAERIVASPGKMSLLAISVQYYARVELLFCVDKSAFSPSPKVDSAIIKITPYSPLPPGEDARRTGEGTTPVPSPSLLTSLPEGGRESRKKFFRVVRAGFSAKRKLLINNLANSFHLDRKVAEAKIKKARVNPSLRAQELSVEDWKKLTELF